MEKLKLFLQLLKEKKYEELYEEFGQEIYVLFADLKYKRLDIKNLVENKEFKKLYEKYGFNELFIDKYYKKNIKELLKDGKYNDILNIYGYNLYEKYKYKIIKSSVSKETGSKIKGLEYVLKEKVKKAPKKIIESSYITLLAFYIVLLCFRSSLYNSSLENNKDLLEKYNQKIEKYIDKTLDLDIDDDLELVMKIMDDMWMEIDGYGIPENESVGLYRIAFAEDNKAGVCRNLADDFSARLNAINPKYEAGTLVVNVDFSYYNKDSFANIKTRKASTYEEHPIITIDDSPTGNHMVSTFKPLGKNYTLVVDPTNPSIGIIANGKVYMFSTLDGKGIDYKILGQAILSLDTSLNKVDSLFINSYIFRTTNEQLDKLNALWGTEAQNKALEKIRSNY